MKLRNDAHSETLLPLECISNASLYFYSGFHSQFLQLMQPQIPREGGESLDRCQA